jgi:hypothetical protein
MPVGKLLAFHYYSTITTPPDWLRYTKRTQRLLRVLCVKANGMRRESVALVAGIHQPVRAPFRSTLCARSRQCLTSDGPRTPVPAGRTVCAHTVTVRCTSTALQIRSRATGNLMVHAVTYETPAELEYAQQGRLSDTPTTTSLLHHGLPSLDQKERKGASQYHRTMTRKEKL